MIDDEDAMQLLKPMIIRQLLMKPSRVVSISFAILIAIGTLLLRAEFSGNGKQIGWIDALFLSTSASCVTGLSTLDIGTSLSLTGQLILLGLIQIGGLGIMTLSVLFIMIAGRRPSLTGRLIIIDGYTHGRYGDLKSLLSNIIAFTLLVEGIGALILIFTFLDNNSPLEALFLGSFHAISSFCNAGFSPFFDSLTGYRDDYLVMLTVSCLIIFGGIGFFVCAELHEIIVRKKRFSQISLHSKLVLVTTVCLIVFGTGAFYLLEENNIFKNMTLPQGLLSAFFHSVSARTAGFNALPIDRLTNGTLLVILFLMFIGASPGSCAGGIKVTTFATMLALGYSRLIGFSNPIIFKRMVSKLSVEKSTSLVLVSVAIVMSGTLLLLLSETTTIEAMTRRDLFFNLLFEVTSAFGTVGYSTGITPSLTVAGKVIVSIVMYAGRVGPLTLFLAFSANRERKYSYAEETIMIG